MQFQGARPEWRIRRCRVRRAPPLERIAARRRESNATCIEIRFRRLHYAEHWRVGTIATQLGVQYETVAAALNRASVLTRGGRYRSTGLDPYLPFRRDTLARVRRMKVRAQDPNPALRSRPSALKSRLCLPPTNRREATCGVHLRPAIRAHWAEEVTER
jgi:hypothetical protein